MKTDLVSILEAACVAGAIALVGCSSDSSSPGGSPGADAGCPGKQAGCPASDAGCPGKPAPTPGDAQTPPTGEATAVTAWLAKGDYKAWKCEPAPHDARSPSPHGKNRICSNDVLSAHGAGEFPVGSAGVKELYDTTGANIIGYATYRKMTAGKGEAWYWFETLDGSGIIANGLGTGGTEKSVCVGCHAGAGTGANSGHDFVFTQVK